MGKRLPSHTTSRISKLFAKQPVGIKAAIITGVFIILATTIQGAFTVISAGRDSNQEVSPERRSQIKATETQEREQPMILENSEPAVWLTYAWLDNVDDDVDYIVQELEKEGLYVKLDRRNLVAGERLWEQIAYYITDPDESKGWVLFATQRSLESSPCREELAYALDRALSTRGNDYPLIAIVPGTVDHDMLPPAIRTRVYVKLSDVDWAGRVAAAVKDVRDKRGSSNITPYELKIHQGKGNRQYAIEMRPRAGTWTPFIAAIPLQEKDEVKPSLYHGPRGLPPNGTVLYMSKSGQDDANMWWILGAQNEATATMSYFLMCDRLPSRLLFGVDSSDIQYIITIGKR